MFLLLLIRPHEDVASQRRIFDPSLERRLFSHQMFLTILPEEQAFWMLVGTLIGFVSARLSSSCSHDAIVHPFSRSP
jgi:hypothetical protein